MWRWAGCAGLLQHAELPASHTPWLSVVLAAAQAVLGAWTLSGVTLRLWLGVAWDDAHGRENHSHTPTRAAQNGCSRITAANPGTITYNGSSNTAVPI